MVCDTYNIQNMCSSTVYAIGQLLVNDRLLSFGESEVTRRFLAVQRSVPQTPVLSKGQLYFENRDKAVLGPVSLTA